MQFMMDFYPDIFPTRKHCLNHLFCTLGNGYKWVNGELVDDDNPYQERYVLRNPIKKAEPKDEHFYNVMKEQEQVWKKLLGNDYKITNQNQKYNFDWYVNYWDIKDTELFNYPVDIKSDWLAAIEECKQLLRDDGILVD